MKRLLTLTILMFATAFLSSASFGQITGSDHDFSSENWNNTGEVCAVCHAPHAGNTTVDFLWAHDVTATVFAPYGSVELDALDVGQPDGASKLCLSCHDGTVAVDSYGGKSGTDFISGGKNVGSDMMANHPVSFTYDAALATTDGELYDPSTASSGLGGTIVTDMLSGGKLQCTSCHDPHGTGVSDFLVMSNAASALCLTCHQK